MANSEKSATSPLNGGISSSAPARKIRSCFVCRQRKVRCDKKSPCGNCHRAKIPCVLPSADRAPRWARRRELLANNAVVASQAAEGGDADLMERVRYLENLVMELTDQLHQYRTTVPSSASGSAGPSPGNTTQSHSERQDLHRPAAEAEGTDRQFGRMKDSRYISSGFWSRIDVELDGLSIDTGDSPGEDSESSADEVWANESIEGADLNSHGYAFLFQHPTLPSGLALHELRPLPSQIPFLLDTFSDNVYPLLCIVHMPSIRNLMQEMRRSSAKALSASNEALMFSIYYAAIVSMEDDDTMTNFGESKSNLSMRYRRGLQDALSRADFLDSPDITLLQALAIFVFLARRHESPRYVYMLCALVIRIAHYLGLHRDGANFQHLSPFEVEIRRRVWWVVVMLDVRASEDQGTEITIKKGSFDTKLPLNVNDTDLDPEAKDFPPSRSGVTDVSFLRAAGGNADITIQVMTAKIAGGPDNYKEQSKLLDEVYASYDREYLQHVTETGNILYWIAKTAARVVMGKLALLVYLPLLFSLSSEPASQEIRDRLFVSAIEVAEGNHALNIHAQQWRWIWQVQTHWYAFVYLLIETTRRPWSPVVERAWVAAHSEWLFPQKSPTHRNMRIWIPLRKLMHRAREHRDAEFRRLRMDPEAAKGVESEGERIPRPAYPGLEPSDSSEEIYRQQWRNLVTPEESIERSLSSDGGFVATSTGPGPDEMTQIPSANFAEVAYQSLGDAQIPGGEAASSMNSHTAPGIEQPLLGGSAPVFADYANGNSGWPNFADWLWADTETSLDMFSGAEVDISFLDPIVDVDGNTNWYDWIESAKAMQ